jgi:hypothetical protein
MPAMRTCSWLAGFLLSLTGLTAARAQSPDALLRCDPGTVIKDIDGAFKSFYPAGDGVHFKECAIPLSPGSHNIEVCFSMGANGTTSIRGETVAQGSICIQSRKLTLDAQPGRTYRVKFDFSDKWDARIDDVTEAEAGLSYDVPAEPPRPAGSKKDLETIVVIRATPENAVLGLQKGVIRGQWLDLGMFGALKLTNLSRKGVPDGYHIYRAHGGDTFAFTSGQLIAKSAFGMKSFTPCEDFRVRVYENIPAGKVLYLGHVSVERGPGYYIGRYIDDLPEARAYIDTHHPELAGRLEAIPYREAKTPNICQEAGTDLRAIAVP